VQDLIQVFQIWLEPDVAGFKNSNLPGAQISGELVLGSKNNTPDEINGVNNALSCYKEAVQFNASFVTSLFANF